MQDGHVPRGVNLVDRAIIECAARGGCPVETSVAGLKEAAVRGTPITIKAGEGVKNRHLSRWIHLEDRAGKCGVPRRNAVEIPIASLDETAV